MGCANALCIKSIDFEISNQMIMENQSNIDNKNNNMDKPKEYINNHEKKISNKLDLFANNNQNNIFINEDKHENKNIIKVQKNFMISKANNIEYKNEDKNKKEEKKIHVENFVINKVNDMQLIPIKNLDNNIEQQKLLDELFQKEIEYKLQLKKYEEIIANYRDPILVGLNNIGATCYMNATLQCLSNTKKLTEYFLKDFKNDDINKKMSNEYYKVVKNLWNRDNHNKSISPNSFKEILSQENPLFVGIQANDSKDLINFLIERFHHELNIVNINHADSNQISEDQMNEQSMFTTFLLDFREKFNSPISNLFYGILETKSQCQGCKIIKFNFQLYSFLEFPLEQVNIYFNSKFGKPLHFQNGKNSDINLYECFEYNRKIDLMNGDNQMFCDRCNQLCDATYTTLVYSGPNYLIINLNRGKGAVYECNVIFPEQLNIINYVTFTQGITVYELYAVICHLGPSSMSGHFVAYCKNSVDHKWYLYNDASINLCTKPQQYNEGMPYILFYKAAVDGT